MLSTPFFVRQILSQHPESLPVLIVSSSNPVAHLIAFYCRIIYHVPILADLGEWHPLIQLAKTSFKSFLAHLLNRVFLYKLYSGILSISTSIASKCRVMRIPSIVVPHSIDTSFIAATSPCAISVRPKPASCLKPLRLLYLGNYKNEDGFLNLVNALTRLDNMNEFRLTTVGSSVLKQLLPGSINLCMASIFNQIHTHKGWVTQEQLYNEILSADLVIIPRPKSFSSNRFSFPTRLAQVLALKRVLAISDTSDIPLYLQSNINYLSLGDGTVDHIVHCLSNPNLHDLIMSISNANRDFKPLSLCGDKIASDIIAFAAII